MDEFFVSISFISLSNIGRYGNRRTSYLPCKVEILLEARRLSNKIDFLFSILAFCQEFISSNELNFPILQLYDFRRLTFD